MRRRPCAQGATSVPQTGHGAHHRARAQTQRWSRDKHPARTQAGSHAQSASQAQTERTQKGRHIYNIPPTPLRSRARTDTHAAVAAPPPPPPRYSRGLPSSRGNAGILHHDKCRQEPMPMHTDPSVAQGSEPRAIYTCTPAPTPRTRAGTTGACQAAARVQRVSSPRP